MVRSDTSLATGWVLGAVYILVRVGLVDIAPPLGSGPSAMELSLVLTGLVPLLVVPGVALGAGYLLEQRDPGGALGLPTAAFGVGALVGLFAGFWLSSALFSSSVSTSGDLWSLLFFAATLLPVAVHAAVAALAGFACGR